jgi:hypothetical protein
MRQITGTVRESVEIYEDTVIDGVIQATVSIAAPAVVTLRGKIQGTATLASGSRLVISGALEGTVSVAPGAEVFVEQGGKLAGSLHNDGDVVLRGVFGNQSGSQTLRIEDQGWIKPPDEIRDGNPVYYW